MGSGGEGGEEVDVVLETEADSQADSSSVVHGEVVTGSRYNGREDNCGTVRPGVGEREWVISGVREWLATKAGEKIPGVAKTEG